ncbi:MAG: spore coat protein CotH [Acidimicrobiia bacterium]|nr:spore coat protein CotH [Acidimicrobiia bacterium]
MTRTRLALTLLAAAVAGTTPFAQGPPMGPGMGPGGLNQPARELVSQFDADKDGRLNAVERKAARDFLAANPTPGRGGGGGRLGGGGGRGGGAAGPAAPGNAISPADVKPASTPLYDDGTLRTLFFTFENSDWDAELIAFNNTDVEVPATLVVDGKTYKDVGVHYRGASSFFGVPAGYKKSLNVAMDFVVPDQHLQGYKTLNLNNANGDPSLMRAVLYEHISSQYIPTPAANFMRVVINGEYWGVYTNVAQFNKDFLRDHFKTEEGVRWKVPGSPGGRGGLEYLGEDREAYKRLYEIKNKDNAASWNALINLTKVLNTTPVDQLEAALAPILNIDGTLRFLALENALVNSDGYWTRASDYNIYLDPTGRFHIIPHDINEAMMAGGPGGGGRGGMGPGGPGMPPPGGGMMPPPPGGGAMVPPQGGRGGGRGGGPGGGGVALDPLVAVHDASKPLISKLLAVPALREKYLGYIRDIATRWLDWNTLGPIAERYAALIRADVLADTKKVIDNAAFESSVAGLKTFADGRRAHLLK